MTVMTPMMTPRSVRNERSLGAVTAFQATRRSSPISMWCLSSSGFLRRVRPRGRVVDLDPIPDREGAERLERPRDDLFAVRQALDDLGLQVGADTGLDLPEVDGPVLLHEEDALNVLFLLGRRAAPVPSARRGRRRCFLPGRAPGGGGVAHAAGGNGDRGGGGAPVRLDLA